MVLNSVDRLVWFIGMSGIGKNEGILVLFNVRQSNLLLR